MQEFVYLNGEYVPALEAKISVFDHGFLYGDGLFETMRAYNGRILLLAEHLDRLFRSARALELVMPWSQEFMEHALSGLISRNGRNLYIRLTVSRGPGPVG
ncbi:MAG: aminotransferase class IV, partial [Eubacteriales bacterium]